jgi:hypothetical protein
MYIDASRASPFSGHPSGTISKINPAGLIDVDGATINLYCKFRFQVVIGCKGCAVMNSKQNKRAVVLVIPALDFGEGRLDLRLPPGISGRVWYYLPMLLAIFAGGRFLPYLLAGVFSVLILAGFYFAPRGVDPKLALAGRGMGIGVGIMCLMATFISQCHRASEGGSYAVMQRRAT